VALRTATPLRTRKRQFEETLDAEGASVGGRVVGRGVFETGWSDNVKPLVCQVSHLGSVISVE